MSTKHRDYDATQVEALHAARQAVKELGFTIKDESDNRFIVSTGLSIRSFGETVVVDVASGDDGVRVTVASEAKAQLIDWGKSDENVDALLAKIDKLLG